MLTECIFCIFYITFVVRILIRHHAMKKQHYFWICCLERHEGSDHTAVALHPGKSPQYIMTGCRSNVYMVLKTVPFLFQESNPDSVVIQPIVLSLHWLIYPGSKYFICKLNMSIKSVKCSYYTDIVYSYSMKKFSFLLSAFTFLTLNVTDSLLLLNCVIMLFVLWEKDSNSFWALKLLLFSQFWNTETLKIMEPAL